MKPVRIAIIGVGNMGSAHAKTIDGIDNLKLTAVCDIDKTRAEAVAERHGVQAFTHATPLLKAGVADAVMIATPHYDHTTIGITALKAGYHVLVEKPISVHKADCEKLLAAYTNRTQVFAAMFNQRTDPHYRKVKEIIDGDELGAITRVNWIITDWFRSQAYYDNGGWRATWKGEGGGVLLNQCPHQLDLLQWLCGMPSAIRAHCHIAKYHTIEVEDEVTAYLEFPTGATGVFIASTGEAPGTNRLEITGERGKIVVENGSVTWYRNRVATSRFRATTPQAFAKPEVWTIAIPAPDAGGQHGEILRNFADTIQKKASLIAPAPEGINSVELANAMLWSSFTGKTVELPLPATAYARHLKKLIRESSFTKQSRGDVKVDMSASF